MDVSSRGNVRDVSIDAARGIGIVLVVFGHAWRGLFNAGSVNDASLFYQIDSAVYMFHMPLFFLLSGITFERVLGRPAHRLLWSRITLLLWPLLIWTWLMGLGKLLFGAAANFPLSPSDFPLLPLPPLWQFWFLWALFVVHVAAYAFSCLQNGTFGWVMACLGSLVLGELTLRAGVVHWSFHQALQHTPYFLLGVLLSRYPRALHIQTAWFALAFFAVQAANVWVEDSSRFLNVTFASIACLAVLGISQAAARMDPRSQAVAAFAFLGTLSLPIYLSHTFFSAPVRVGLSAIGIEGTVPHLAFGTAAGLLFPILLAFAARRLGATRLIGF